jgi:anti-sigma regulatory factor (Ser/Thr protein kinase)
MNPPLLTSTGSHVAVAAPPMGLVFRGDAAGGRDARTAARALLERHGVARDCVDTATLVVSELVTNAIRHAEGPYTLRVIVSAVAVEIAVSDPSPTPPRTRAPDLIDGTGGFGSLIIAQLARRVLVDRHDDGKTIKVVLDR